MVAMRYAWVGCLLCGLLSAGTPIPNSNANSRYTVENVIVSGNGWSADLGAGGEADREKKISPSLRKQLSSFIGNKFNPAALEAAAKQLRKELNARTVGHRVMRGAKPEYVKVVFDVNDRNPHIDASVPKFLYNSRQGWTGSVEVDVGAVRQNFFSFGIASDGNELAERYAGLSARYENARLGTDRVRLRFAFESYHQQWNRATLEHFDQAEPVSASASLTSAPYRTRQNFEPTVTFVVSAPVTVAVGASFERFQEQYPTPHTEAANAVTGSIRYAQTFEGSEYEQDLGAGYALRAGTGALESDFSYARHSAEVRYALRHGRHELVDEATAGVIGGRAPLYERFYLGNSSTLRGWNKFEIDPVGGNRMVHNSVEYRYGPFEIFYDTGAIWDSGVQPATVRHGIGVGLRQRSFALALAFPVRSGRADPIFMMGMNY